MSKSQLLVLAAGALLSQWLLSSGAAEAAAAAKEGAASAAAKRSLVTRRQLPLKQLVPEEDYSIIPDPGELFDKAVKAYAAGHMPQAKKLFEQVLTIDPRNADAHFNLGAICEWANDLDGALQHYLAAQAIKPNDREIADAVASVQFKIKNKPALDAQARRAKEEHDLAMHSALAKQAFADQNYADAITHLSYLAHAMPEDAKVQFALGQSLRALKFYDYAAYRLKLAIFLDPENELYRKTLVDLDKEVQDVQGQAYAETAELALKRIGPLSFTELGDTGMYPHVF